MTLKEFLAKHDCTSKETLELKQYLAFIRIRHVLYFLFGGELT
jgi:hypothetical protein